MTIRSASDGSEADPTAADRTDARMSAKMANKSLKFILTSFVFAVAVVDEPEDVEAVQEDPLDLLLELHLVFVELGRVLPGDHEELPECILQFLGFVVLAVEGLSCRWCRIWYGYICVGGYDAHEGIGRGTKTK